MAGRDRQRLHFQRTSEPAYDLRRRDLRHENQGTLTVNGSTFSGNARQTALPAAPSKTSAGTATLDDDIFSASNTPPRPAAPIDNQGTLDADRRHSSPATSRRRPAAASTIAAPRRSPIARSPATTRRYGGGGIENASGGTLTLSDSTLSGNIGLLVRRRHRERFRRHADGEQLDLSRATLPTRGRRDRELRRHADGERLHASPATRPTVRAAASTTPAR